MRKTMVSDGIEHFDKDEEIEVLRRYAAVDDLR
jgi:hypothetical protein